MGPTFEEILSGRLPGGAVSFSPEAKAQLQGQGVELGPIDLDRLSRTIDRVADEGGRKCLLLDQEVAYVVDVDERKVTSAGARSEVKDDVFTEIDSAVLIG
jgi:flagellar operon protein